MSKDDKARVAALMCKVCGAWSTLPVEKLPLPIPGLSVSIEIDPASDGYMVTVNDWATGTGRHAYERILMPLKSPLHYELRDCINKALKMLAVSAPKDVVATKPRERKKPMATKKNKGKKTSKKTAKLANAKPAKKAAAKK